MQFVVKYFSEIAIKSTPVRRKFERQLQENLRVVLRDIDPEMAVRRVLCVYADRLEQQTFAVRCWQVL